MKRRAIGLAMALGCAVLLGSGHLAAADLKAHLLAALDSPEGRSEGDLSGPMAEFFQAQTRSSATVLPIPALDGGHVVFTLYEMITRRKPNEKFLEYAQVAGMVILLTLLVYANGNDIVGLFR